MTLNLVKSSFFIYYRNKVKNKKFKKNLLTAE